MYDNEALIENYNLKPESARLVSRMGRIEMHRTKEIIRAAFPTPPAVVLDIGGGPGRYAHWLASLGYAAHLLDPVPRHIEEALAAEDSDHPLASARVGDARALPYADAFADAALFCGPLYHLIKPDERRRALEEALRVLRPGGVLLAGTITIFASTHVGLVNEWVFDPAYLRMCDIELHSGRHIRPEGSNFFIDSYFHHPESIRPELESAGFRFERTLALEGSTWLCPNFDAHWENPEHREALLKIAKWTENEPTAIGLSPHVISICRKPA